MISIDKLSIITPPMKALDGLSVTKRTVIKKRLKSSSDNKQPCQTPVEVVKLW